jgi:hypothetical protein
MERFPDYWSTTYKTSAMSMTKTDTLPSEIVKLLVSIL